MTTVAEDSVSMSLQLPFDVEELFSHCLLYGAMALCEEAGIEGLTVRWSGEMGPQPVLSGVGLSAERMAEIVLAHARRHAAPDSWLQQPLPHDPKRALMSPRVTSVGDARPQWDALMDARWAVEQQLETNGDGLSSALIGALGQPASWRFNRAGQRLQDDGASRLEMQPRNNGSELVGTKMRALAAVLASRSTAEVVAGLVNGSVVDDLAKNSAGSRTATNLRSLGPTDSAPAWVALWGISQIPLAHRVRQRSATATHVVTPRTDRSGHFVLPTWTSPWRPAKLRAVLASGQLQDACMLVAGVDPEHVPPDPSLSLLRRTRGVEALVDFPIGVYGSASAPERRALRGHVLALPF